MGTHEGGVLLRHAQKAAYRGVSGSLRGDLPALSQAPWRWG